MIKKIQESKNAINEFSKVASQCWSLIPFRDRFLIANHIRNLITSINQIFGIEFEFIDAMINHFRSYEQNEKPYFNFNGVLFNILKCIPLIGTIVGIVGLKENLEETTRQIGEFYLGELIQILKRQQTEFLSIETIFKELQGKDLIRSSSK